MIGFTASVPSLTGTEPSPVSVGSSGEGFPGRATRRVSGGVGEGRRADAAPAFAEERALFTCGARGRLARAPAEVNGHLSEGDSIVSAPGGKVGKR